MKVSVTMTMGEMLGRPALAAGAAIALLLAGGCTRIQEHQGFLVDQIIVDSVLAGVDNKESVAGSMGRPTFVSQFGPERWYYVSRVTKQLAFGDPKPINQSLFIVQFDADGNVASIDRNLTLAQVAKVSPEGDKTPTLGRSRSFLDEIFGNIGTVGTGMGGTAAPSGPGPNGS